MPTLTVFLAPDGPAGGVLDVLTDLSAAGLVEPFLWVSASSAEAAGLGAVGVDQGRRRPATVEDAVADKHHDRVRLCVVVPLSGPGTPVPMATEQQLSETVEFAGITAPVTRIRCIVARPGDHTQDDVLARGGWHNILIAPEDARGPGMGRQQLPPSDDPVDIGRHAAPAVAGIVGLWSGVDHSPFDDQQPQPGVRAGRSFYRRVDAGAVERDLRTRVLATQPRLPLPRDHTTSAVYVEDGEQACATMAYHLWGKHRQILVGDRVVAAVEPPQQLNFRNALVLLLRYIWAALKNAPGDWYQGQLNQGATMAARRVHSIVFGSGDSAYVVVAGGMTPEGLPAGWRDVSTASGRLDDLLVTNGEHEHHPRVDLSSMWADFAAGAMTLADAGTRAPAMPPVQVGASRGVLRSVAQCAPAPDLDFTGIPPHLGARVGISRVAPGDVLTADVLRRRLAHLGAHQALAQDTGSTSQALTDWMKQLDGCYSVQVGKTIAGSVQTVVEEIQQYLATLRKAADEQAPTDQHGGRGLRRWIRVLTVFAVLAAVAAPVLAIVDVVPVRVAVLLGVVPILAWLAVALAGFAREQREMFRDLHRRRTLLSAVEAARANLRQATRDLRRLTDAYEQYLVWSRIVGVVLREPFGPGPSDASQSAVLAFGLPRTTRIARALVDESTMGAAATALRSELFTAGWLSDLWRAHLDGAAAQLGSHELMARPEGLFDLHGGVVGSALQAWADLLVHAGTAAAPGDGTWARVMSSLDSGQAALGEALLSSVQGVERGDHGPTGLADFLSGVDEPADAGGRQVFAGEHFTSDARAEVRSRVTVHEFRQARIGLSRVAVLVQLTDARPAWEFAVIEVPDEQPGPPPIPPPAPSDAESITDSPVDVVGSVRVPMAPEGRV